MAVFFRCCGYVSQAFSVQAFQQGAWDTISVICHKNMKSVGLCLTADADVTICLPAAKTMFNAVFHERLQKKWREEIEQGDPYYNRNLTLHRADYSMDV